MSGIFGLVALRGDQVRAVDVSAMGQAMRPWSADGQQVWSDAHAALGHGRLIETPEGIHEQQPFHDATSDVVFTSSARLDNRDEVADGLDIGPAQLRVLADTELVRRAYLRWGTDHLERLRGDWAFAAWHPRDRILRMARDPYGTTALYYHAGPGLFAFASSRAALLALDAVPRQLDDLFLAQLLVCWTAYIGDRTSHAAIRRLPPAHCLTVANGSLVVRRYWQIEDVDQLRLPRREDYVPMLASHLERAVRVRLRSPGPVGVTLSGGLDSTSVAVQAAEAIRGQGTRLSAFVSVPLGDGTMSADGRFGNEWPQANATATLAGNIDLTAVRTPDLTPIDGLRSGLAIHHEPQHGAGNLFWFYDLERTAYAHGCRVLLTGQAGNRGLSWTGLPGSQRLWPWLGARHWRVAARIARARWRQLNPRAAHARQRRQIAAIVGASGIHPALSRHLDLQNRMADDLRQHSPRTVSDARRDFLRAGRTISGAFHAEVATAFGLSVRDPTADSELLRFTLSIPDDVFMDAGSGLDRWPAREVLRGRAPETVRLERRRGQQSSDLVARLRVARADVEVVLGAVASGPAGAFLDVTQLQAHWNRILTVDTAETKASADAFMRALMVGMFLS